MTDYHAMSIGQKQRHQREAMREPAIACPSCETQLVPADLLPHFIERCPGRREPHPAARWLTWREARSLGVTAGTLHRLAKSGIVRSRGKARGRLYLARDLVLVLAWLALLAGRSLGNDRATTPHPPMGLGPSSGTPAYG